MLQPVLASASSASPTLGGREPGYPS
ncbi:MULTISPECIES: hypothetical protein [unclassified Moorena]